LPLGVDDARGVAVLEPLSFELLSLELLSLSKMLLSFPMLLSLSPHPAIAPNVSNSARKSAAFPNPEIVV